LTENYKDSNSQGHLHTHYDRRREETHPIVAVDLYRMKQPLKEPYHLSFATFHSFDTFLIQVRTEDGRTAWGEVTACQGYVPESAEDIWDFLCAHGPKVVGMSPETAIESILPYAAHGGYPVSPLMTALELVSRRIPSGDEPKVVPSALVPLVGLLSAEHEPELESGFWTQIERKYTTIKVKVGFDVSLDIHRVTLIQELARQAPGTLIRIDANQGYSFDDAREFVQKVTPEAIELFEQPFPAGDWESQVSLSRISPLPLMLDESILGTEDVERTAALGCAQFVKFKLMKSGGVRLLGEQVALAKRLGLTVVLGNGVSGEIGCHQEASAAVGLGIKTAGEMNGFLKLQTSILRRPLISAPGGVVVDPEFQAVPDLERVPQMVVDQQSWAP